jgi:hypothetical protein
MPRQNTRIGSALVFMTGCFLGALVGFFVGWSKGDREGYHRIFVSQKSLIEPALRESTDYDGLVIEEESQGDAHLTGRVPSETSLDLLRSKMKELFGSKRADELTRNITVRKGQ